MIWVEGSLHTDGFWEGISSLMEMIKRTWKLTFVVYLLKPGIVPSAICVLTHLRLKGRVQYDSYFTDEELRHRGLRSTLPKVTQLVNSWVRIQTQPVWLRSPDCKPRKNLEIFPKSLRRILLYLESASEMPLLFCELPLWGNLAVCQFIKYWEMSDSLVCE